MTAWIKPGTVIDERYEVVSRIGGGGMGEIFKARELDLGRVVAVKVLHTAQLGDEDSLARFEREGKILSDLSHKNITVLYRFGVWQQSTPYIAMEYLEGTSLRTALDEHRKFKPARAISIMQQVTEAMSFAHERGIVHRDLTPNNIMLIAQPEPDTVKLIDFGLAKVFEKDEQMAQHLTQTGLLIGSVFYMSPEQCQGRKSDARSDIYSLGCVLYETVAGQPPLIADNPIGLMHKHVFENPRPLSDFLNKSEVPAGLQAVVSKAMAKDPMQRYQSMSDFCADLNLVAGGRGEEIIAGEAKPQEKRKVLVPLLVFICAGTAVGAGFMVMKPAQRDSSAEQQKRSLSKRSTPLGLKGQIEQIVKMPASKERLALELRVIERMTASPNELDAAQRRTIFLMTSNDFMELNEDEKAMAYLKIGLKGVSPSEDPAHTAHFYRHMASVQRKTGDHASAVRNLEQATKAWKPFGKEQVVLGSAYSDLADSLFILGRYDQAEKTARRSLENITPDSESHAWFQSMITLQSVLLQKKKTEEEAAVYEGALKTLSRLPVSVTMDYFNSMRVHLYPLGLFTLVAQRMEDCLAQVLQHKDKNVPYTFSAYLLLGETYENLGQYERSSQVYKTLLVYLEKQPEDLVRRKTALLKLAQSLAASSKYSESQETYKKVLPLPMEESERVRVLIALYNMTMLVDYRSELAKRYELAACNALRHVSDPVKRLSLSLELSEVLGLRQEFDKGMSVLTDARQSAAGVADAVLLARVDNQLGHLCLLRKEPDKAESFLSGAIPELERSAPDQRYVGAFNELGQCSRMLHHEAKTDKLVASVVEEARDSKNARNLFFALLDAGVYARDSGNKKQSIAYCLDATRIVDRTVSPAEHLHAVVNLGTAYCENDDYESALKLIQPQYESIATVFAGQNGEGKPRFQVEMILASSYRTLGQKEKAIEHFKLGAEIAPAIYPTIGVVDACFALHRYDEAMDYIKRAKDLLSRSPDRANTRTILPVKLREAHCLYLCGKIPQSKKIVTELLALEKSINFEDAEAYWVLELAAEIALAEGDKKSARAYIEHEIERFHHYQGDGPKAQARIQRLKELEAE